MDQAAAKQQVVERIKQANNILVTVSNDPSVDQLAACIGVTLFLNKIDKHATAVFSGQVPSTLEFLQPEKTIETNTDSLRDFIISLDKAKADKIRYKVEDKFVRIYITPYKTSLSDKDLMFSQGDYNVEVVLALGVRDKSQLDAAITAHGRILHDASIISVNIGKDKTPNLGQINWQDPAASSLCEMLVSISEAFGAGLIDNQMATAFLTGIVAETARFSNPRTSPKVMTMAAQLMAAGANQQLIVSKLEPPKPPPEAAKPVPPKSPPKKPPSDTLTISHDKDKKKEEPDQEVEVKPREIYIDEKGNIVSLDERRASDLREFEPSQDIGLDKKPPGPHELLDPTNHQPVLSSPFTASMQSESDQPNHITDPLMNEATSDDVLLKRTGGGDDDTPTLPTPTVDDARKAVSAAVTSESFDPTKAVETAEKPAPPPLPPPLIPPK